MSEFAGQTIHDRESTACPGPFPVAGGEPWGGARERESCVSGMAKVDPLAEAPNCLVFNVNSPLALAE